MAVQAQVATQAHHAMAAGPKTSTPSGWNRFLTKMPSLFAWMFGAVAVLCAVTAISVTGRWLLSGVRFTVDYVLIPAPANLAYAVFLGILAAAVARRKRVAYWLVFSYLILGLVADALVWGYVAFAPGLSDSLPWWVYPTEAASDLIDITLLVLLVCARSQFYARTQRGSVLKALAVLTILLIVAGGTGYGLVRLFPGSLNTHGDQFTWAIERVLGGVFVLDVNREGHSPHWVNLVLGLLGAVALLAAFLTLFRSQRAAAELPASDEQRIRALLAEHGHRDSLGYFATRRDKAAIFSPSGKAAITYRPVNGVSLASADPIGDPEAWGPAIERWLANAREFAWTPAVMGASDEGAKAYARAGLKVIELGDEAIVYTNEFSLDGRDMRIVRQAVHRVQRLGYTAKVRRHAEIPAEEMARVTELAAKWRDTEAERGFSMALGRLGDPADGECVLVEAVRSDGRLAAILSFSPWGADGLSLDLMRRAQDADNGLVEFLAVALIQQASRLKVRRVSLNFAVFRSAFEQGARIGAGPVLRAWRSLLLFLSRWWQLESLYRANAKYNPHWEPRYLCFAERRELVKVGVAAAIAEGFLTVPSFGNGRKTAQEQRDVVEATLTSITASQATEIPKSEQGEQQRVRLGKIARLRDAGIDPYPVGYPRDSNCLAIRTEFGGLAPDQVADRTVWLAGRIILNRDHGKLCFAKLRDGSGDIQLMLTINELGADQLNSWKAIVDLGDHVGVHGTIATSRTGELSILVKSWQLTAKCVTPLPDKHRGLIDPETKVRQRYLDLALNERTRSVLYARAATFASLRDSLWRRGYVETQTPILQPVHGGANARPFITHSNTYDMRLYLRIAPELYLKRLAVGGMEKVFELGPTFRNEGISFKHNPEFSMLEAYQAYADYDDMRVLCRELVIAAAAAAQKCSPDAVVMRDVHSGGDTEVHIGGDWPVLTVNDAISGALGEQVSADTTREQLVAWCERAGVPVDPSWSRGAVILEMYERLVESKTVAPTFYKDFPADVSPLTRGHRDDPRLAERWDMVAFGLELATAYSELIDPVEQRKRLTEQSLLAAGGDSEAMELDEDFLRALEFAMPPTGGLGMGVDRLVMLLTGCTIRETLPFPLAKPDV